MRLLYRLSLIAVATLVSYWLFLYQPGQPLLPESGAEGFQPEITVAPEVEAQPATVSEPEPPPPPLPAPDTDALEAAAVAEPAVEAPVAPPSPEIGEPEGDEESNAPEAVRQEDEAEAQAPDPQPAADDKALADAERVREEIAELARSAALVTQAEKEIAGRSRRGLGYTFQTAPRDQVAIARFFDEPIVLVPRAALKSGEGFHYRLDTGSLRIERVRGLPPLDRYHKIRNLFDFPYDRLTPALRALRRKVPNRGDIWVFGALIPPAEWAVVIARRREAVAEANRRRGGTSRTLNDVRNIELEYEPLPGGGFDIRVTRILFIDGTQWVSRDES